MKTNGFFFVIFNISIALLCHILKEKTLQRRLIMDCFDWSTFILNDINSNIITDVLLDVLPLL